MTKQNNLKELVRARMAKTGERYTVALAHVLAARETVVRSLIQTTMREAKHFVTVAIEKESRLTHFGLGIYDEWDRRAKAMASPEAAAEFERDFKRERAALYENLVEVAAAADWIKLQKPVGTYNLRHSSYGYKHAVERWFRRRGQQVYVSNGSFIAAAVGLGFEGRPDERGSPNICFKFSKLTLKATERATVAHSVSL